MQTVQEEGQERELPFFMKNHLLLTFTLSYIYIYIYGENKRDLEEERKKERMNERKKRMTGFFPFSLLEQSDLYRMIFWFKLIYSVEDISANLLVDLVGVNESHKILDRVSQYSIRA